MMKKYFIILMALIMVFSFAACGGKQDPAENVPQNTDIYTEPTCDLAVEIIDKHTAKIVCEFPDDQIQTCDVNFGDYGVYLNRDYDSGTYYCNLYSSNNPMDVDMPFTIDGNTVTFDVNMTGINDFSFKKVKTYSTLTIRGADDPATQMTYDAADVVIK